MKDLALLDVLAEFRKSYASHAQDKERRAETLENVTS